MAHQPFSFGLPLKNQFAEFAFQLHFMLPHEWKNIQKLWEEDRAEQAGLSGGQEYKDDLRKTQIVGVENNEHNNWLYQRLGKFAIGINQQRYHFDLLGIHEPLQLMRYGHDDFFDWHLDFGVGATSDRKLSVTIQLSDPKDYEGGDLEFMINQNIVKAPREQGTVIVFPSFIIHRVTPVTKGVRQSIVGWVAGPPFR